VLVQQQRDSGQTAFDLVQKAYEQGLIPQREYDEILEDEGEIEDAEIIEDGEPYENHS
jgi:hypothetical protein